jgi:hypothetical protein
MTAPALMLALVVVRGPGAGGVRASRSVPARPDARCARQHAEALEPNSVVITTEDVGRPAENIEFGGVARDVPHRPERWRFNPAIATWIILDHKRPYLFIPASQREGRSCSRRCASI